MPKRVPSHLAKWLDIGRKNQWIRQAEDPRFTDKSFSECLSFEDLADMILRGNWCLGQAFYCGDICLINQVNGGDEWLVIKGYTSFESFTCEALGRERLLKAFHDIKEATEEQCRALEYGNDQRS